MEIRRAAEQDMEGINRLLLQVCRVHHEGRPDLFTDGGKKYSDEELQKIIRDDERPVFVGVDEAGNVLGYAFCIFERYDGRGAMTERSTLYIDDLCVDERIRGRHIGTQIYDAVTAFARESGCYNVTLNVWCCNPSAMKFYEARGLKPLKIGMEAILER